MHPVDQLKADPQRFIRKNMLSLNSMLDDPHPSLIKPNGAVEVTLIDWAEMTGAVATRVRNRKGLAKLFSKSNKSAWEKTANYYAIVAATAAPGQPSFDAYICPYLTNSTKMKFLGNAANFMFTGDMDGCSFGVGSATRDGSVLVGHANAVAEASSNPNFSEAEGTAAQRDAQRRRLERQGLGKIIDPNVYRGDNAGFKAITIGLRSGKHWNFWYQHQELGGELGAPTGHMMALTPLK